MSGFMAATEVKPEMATKMDKAVSTILQLEDRSDQLTLYVVCQAKEGSPCFAWRMDAY